MYGQAAGGGRSPRLACWGALGFRKVPLVRRFAAGRRPAAWSVSWPEHPPEHLQTRSNTADHGRRRRRRRRLGASPAAGQEGRDRGRRAARPDAD
eukprot:SAG31_NODE_7117_length_1784_cov_3.031454_1_plen_94_part_10